MPDIIARELFPKNLQRYMADAGLSQTDVARRLGVSKQTVSEWISGKKFPRVDRMQQLADLFSVLMSDLYTDHSDPDPSVLTSDEAALLAQYRRLPPHGKRLLMDRASELTILCGEKSEDPGLSAGGSVV